jgi:4-hydroxybutyrate CoA-transferase
MEWKDYYANHLATAQEAVKSVESGDRVVLGHATGEPQIIVDALVERASELENVEIVHLVAMGKGEYCKPEYERNFRHNALFVGAPTRQAVKEGRADFTPIYFHQIPELFRSKMPIDVAMVTVSPPDKYGYVNLGISVDYTFQAIASAKTVIAEVNSNMPRTWGRTSVRVEDIDYFVETDIPIHELKPPIIGDVEKAIGHNVASLIKDGDCLQLGIGAIPDAVLSCLGDKNDLGIHSEMIADGVKKLVEDGVVTCRKKNYLPDKIVITFAMGTSEFYKWLDYNPMIEALPVDIVNNPYVIAKNDNMVAINSTISVDLLGQVASDTLGAIQFSGVGGQVDFVRGATNSKGGRAIIAMPSTATKGKVSRICTILEPGQATTTSRFDVDYVVTEYGIAHLRGKTNLARSEELIKIAAPEYRDMLLEQRKQIFGW